MDLFKKSVTLMGPGPSDVPQSILDKMAYPTVGHLDPDFVDLMDDIKRMLRLTFKTDNEMTFPLSAPGSAGMEAAFANLLECGEKVVIFQNGVFGGRMADIAKRQGLKVIKVEEEWGKAISAERVDQVLGEHKDTVALAFVHAETSTGVLSDAKSICEVARAHGAFTIVDTVTSLAGSPLEVDDWNIDITYSGTQKCLSAPPGISPMSFSSRAMDKIKNRKTPCLSWFLDVSLLLGYWQGSGGKRSYHHTAPVNAMYGLHEALRLVQSEGLEKRWQRHREIHLYLESRLSELGIKFFVAAGDRIPQLNAVAIPAEMDDALTRKTLLEKNSIEIGGGLGPLAGKIWRIGTMGASATKDNVDLLVAAIREMY